jgi:thymidine phosphorylase
VQIGRELGREVSPVLTAMDQPLGSAVGNALEVGEAAVTLRGAGPSDLVEVVVALAARLLAAHDASIGLEGARARAREQLASGRAWETFLRWVRAQGGDPAAVENPERLPHAAHQLEVRAPAGGHVCTLGARAVGQLAMALGAGRERKEDQIDPAAGIVLKAKIGDRVEAGQVLAVLHSNRSIDEERCSRRLLAAIKLTQEEIGRPATVVQA